MRGFVIVVFSCFLSFFVRFLNSFRTTREYKPAIQYCSTLLAASAGSNSNCRCGMLDDIAEPYLLLRCKAGQSDTIRLAFLRLFSHAITDSCGWRDDKNWNYPNASSKGGTIVIRRFVCFC